MQLQMGTLENSYDFLHDSLDFYKKADEYGIHDAQKANHSDKKKWKMAFICLVQATELLLKVILSEIHPVLLFENIDLPLNQNDKTVSFSKAVIRLRNFHQSSLTDEEIQFLNSCAKTRNCFTHSEAMISTPDLKPRYCKLFKLYKSIHNNFLGTQLQFANKEHEFLSNEIEYFAEKYVIIRGVECHKDLLEQFLKDIDDNKKYSYVKTSDGRIIPRIKFGEEIKDRTIEKNKDTNFRSIYEYDYCDDCTAKQGEPHLLGCDLEICPTCFMQGISCHCDNKVCDIDGNEYEHLYFDV